MVTTKELKEYIQSWADHSGEPLVSFDGLDEAIIGVATTHTQPVRVVYSMSSIISILMSQGMGQEEALEYFDFNIACLWAGDNTPAIMYDGTLD